MDEIRCENAYTCYYYFRFIVKMSGSISESIEILYHKLILLPAGSLTSKF
ncbi:protein of unknown function [Candidatus Nitrosocosmicus franklandus]|uniref:Uncharacterized protein n=1 Tax=Candidatus Nitrosocosmicus franklandianus TaxID=1798806 RepID=A0A484IA02_9ARCH|nr:protein of unknown function [Candidatus Nitrosocosmicus franklandus]